MSSRPSRVRKPKSFVLESDSESDSLSDASICSDSDNDSDSDSDGSSAFEEPSTSTSTPRSSHSRSSKKPSARTPAPTHTLTHTPKSNANSKSKTTPKPSSIPSASGSTKKRKLETSTSTSTSTTAAAASSTSSSVKKRVVSAGAGASAATMESASGNGGTGAASGWKGAPVASEAAARRLVQQYVMAQNRPYSVIQVYDNLHHRAGKAVVQRALDELSSGPNKCLAFKDYGKARIYFPDQSLLQNDFSSDDLARLDAESSRLDGTLKDLQQREASLRVEARQLESQPPDNTLEGAMAEEQARAEGLRARLAAMNGKGMRAVTEQDRTKAAAAHKKYRTAWRERKSKVRDLIDMMADGMEKPVKFVTELLGIETDEECGVSLPPVLT